MKFRPPAYSYDDVLLEPRNTEMRSRLEPSLSTRLTRRTSIDIPLIASNMDTITEVDMMVEMDRLGGVAILHRFMGLREIIEKLEEAKRRGCAKRFFSVGIDDELVRETLHIIYKRGLATGVCIDTAHGDCKRVIDLIYHIEQNYHEWDKIAGNVATGEAVKRYCIAGVDAIKVGIGPGSLCTTRTVTGCGVPQLTAIIECAEAAREYDVPVIADGGIRTSGDVVKALAAGAEAVMIGSILAGTDETPGAHVDAGGEEFCSEAVADLKDTGMITTVFKQYRGMASRDAMSDWKGSGYKRTPEGEAKLVQCKGPVKEVIQELIMGIRSGMTYQDADTIKQLHANAVFRQVTPLGYNENGAHGLGQ